MSVQVLAADLEILVERERRKYPRTYPTNDRLAVEAVLRPHQPAATDGTTDWVRVPPQTSPNQELGFLPASNQDELTVATPLSSKPGSPFRQPAPGLDASARAPTGAGAPPPAARTIPTPWLTAAERLSLGDPAAAAAAAAAAAEAKAKEEAAAGAKGERCLLLAQM